MTQVILAIDTATPAVTAGIVRRGEGVTVLAERVTVDARAHAERLTPNVLAALTDAGLGMADLGAVVVGCGPGPFTGLRVGMATAAAYGHALGIPVHGVCSLDAIGVQTGGEALVVTDARRRRGVLGALPRRGPHRGPRRWGPRPMSTPARRRRWPGRRRMLGCSAYRCSTSPVRTLRDWLRR
ncbi:tRNA threonylcarbamoyladenosine biosynthesis protein TsaB [Mycobacterium talmoniae]|uniref:tRNA threonylcarbamoyladenosine biosynthesis protein TsaB n=1 Tax=Mycobacterium talmoniae TaxID=1858794 RepID=A0A2S8BJ21_9MYCO|nr:tRNA threonylcarbamoyladenosine biosynthesis protein TsaB [Mycobacterium talmoniae]